MNDQMGEVLCPCCGEPGAYEWYCPHEGYQVRFCPPCEARYQKELAIHDAWGDIAREDCDE